MKYKKIGIGIISVLALFAVLIMIISDFSIQMKQDLKQETYKTLSEVSKTYNKVFNDRISSAVTAMNIIIGSISETHIPSDTEIINILQNSVENGGFAKMAICGMDGVSLSNDGIITDISYREYFKKAISGKTDINNQLTLVTNEDNTKEMIIIAVPIKNNETIKGVLFGGYPMAEAGKHLLDTTYYSEGYGYIVASDGKLILSSDHSDKMVDGDNLITFFEKTDFVDFSIEELKTKIEQNKSGCFTYAYQGKRRFVSFTPSIIKDWYTFNLSSDESTLKKEQSLNQIVFRLIIKLLVIAVLILAWNIINNNRKNKKLIKQEEALRTSENRFSIAVNASNGALFELDINKQIFTHFENAEHIFGVSSQKLLLDTAVFSTLKHDEYEDAINNRFFHPDDCSIIKSEMKKLTYKNTASFEARVHRFDNRYIWCKIDISMTFDSAKKPTRLVGFISDIDAIKTQAILSEIKAQTDPMTELYNKTTMENLANEGLKKYPKGLHALMVLDIDNFKNINDTLGHAFGDLVLIDISTKLKSAFRSNDIVGRIGGDEFAVLMKNVSDTSSVLKKGTELSGIFRQTYVGEKKNCKISCSIGIIMINSNDDSFETLYRKADAALYQAKQNGKNQFILYKEQDSKKYPIENTRTNDEEQQNLKRLHTLEAYIFELLYTTNDFYVSINMALAAIGQQFHVSRVFIFEYDEENCTAYNSYEWCNEGVSSEIDNMQNLKLSSGEDSILDCFDKNGLMYCSDIRELPLYVQDILEKQHVLSTLQVTISNDKRIFGFIGFDDCNECRAWTSEEIDKLSFLSKVLSVFLFKKKAESALLENLNTHLGILNVLPDYICVVNPETHTIEYTNKKMQELIPSVKAGAFCFKTLRNGQNSPCETCLVERIKRGDTEDLTIIDKDRKISLNVSALEINWTNDRKMVLLHGIEENKKQINSEIKK